MPAKGTDAAKKHGGARPGAGRASDGSTDLRRVSVMLDPLTITKATKAGEGNLSAGIRLIVAKFRTKKRDDP